MGHVFISYSTKNKDYADTLRDMLEAQRVTTWMAPYSIPPGSKYAQTITKGIRDCDCFLLVLSEASQASEAVDSEVELATLTYHKPTLVVQIEDVVLNDAFTFYVHNKHMIRMDSVDVSSRECRALVQEIKHYTQTPDEQPLQKEEQPPQKEEPVIQREADPNGNVTKPLNNKKPMSKKVIAAVIAVVIAVLAAGVAIMLSGKDTADEKNGQQEQTAVTQPVDTRPVNPSYTAIFEEAGLTEKPVVSTDNEYVAYAYREESSFIYKGEIAYENGHISEAAVSTYISKDMVSEEEVQQFMLQAEQDLNTYVQSGVCSVYQDQTETHYVYDIHIHITQVTTEEGNEIFRELFGIDYENMDYLSRRQIDDMFAEMGFVKKFEE